MCVCVCVCVCVSTPCSIIIETSKTNNDTTLYLLKGCTISHTCTYSMHACNLAASCFVIQLSYEHTPHSMSHTQRDRYIITLGMHQFFTVISIVSAYSIIWTSLFPYLLQVSYIHFTCVYCKGTFMFYNYDCDLAH